MTRLADLVAGDRVVVPLESATLPGAALALLDRLVTSGAVADADRLRARIAEERAEDIVAMGDRAFLLHYRTDAAPELAVALGTAQRPICRELGDEGVQCARVLLLVVAPPKRAARYLQVVGAFARFLANPERVDALLAAGSARELAALPALSEYTLPEQLSVRDLMTERPRSVSPDTPIRDAARDLVRQRVGGLPVVDATGQVVGMLGEREIMRHMLTSYLPGGGPPGGGAPARPNVHAASPTVREVMTRQVLCVSPETPIAEVASIMTNKDVDRVPVVRDGRLVGLLTRGDIVRKLIGTH